MTTEQRNEMRTKIEKNLFNKGRKVTNWWDDDKNPVGLPVHRPMTPWEKYDRDQKRMNVPQIDEKTFNLGMALLSTREGSNMLIKGAKI